MPAQSRLGDLSTGHGCFPPTPAVTTPCTRTFVNNQPALVVGAQFATHVCGKVTHPQSGRPVVVGSPNVFKEGQPAARIADPIGCGDTIGQGSPNVFVNG